MDREIAPEVRRGVVVRRIVTLLITVGAMGLLFAASLEWLRPSVRRSDLQFATVRRGEVEATVQANGTVVPLVEQVVSSPLEARVLRVGRRPGDHVSAGDALLTLDTGAARIEAERLGDRVAQSENELAQLRLRLDESIASLEAQLEQKKLDAEILHYAAVQKEKLRASGLIAEQEALGAAASAKKSDIEIRQLHEALERSRRSREAQLASATGNVTIARRDRTEAGRQLELAMLRAPRAGVVTWLLSEEGATVRKGDMVGRIADLSAYRVEATISDVHASRLAAGMKTWVRFDGAAIAGRIDSIDPRIEQGVVRFYVVLDQPSHPGLRNNLRVEVEVVTGSKSGTLVVERGALARSNATEAFVVRGSRLVRVPVRFGLAGGERIEITSGVREGDRVVVSEVSELEGIREVRLK